MDGLDRGAGCDPELLSEQDPELLVDLEGLGELVAGDRPMAVPAR